MPDEIIMPHSIELEEGLLSALFDDAESLNDVSQILKSEHFYSSKNRHIFSAFMQILFDGDQPEAAILLEALRKSGRADEIGGIAALAKLKHLVPPAGNVVAYAEKIRDLASKRYLIANAHAIIKRAICGDDVDSTIKFAYDQLQAITKPKIMVGSRGVHISNVYTAERMVEQYQEYLKNIQDNRFVTGIKPIDRQIRGIGGGEVITIIARAGSFKTAMLQNLLLRYTKSSSFCAAFFSLEMPVPSITERYFEILDGCPGHEVERMFLDKSQADLVGASVSQFKRDLDRLLIIDVKISLENIPQYIEIIQREMGKKIGLVGIDYLGLMDAPGRDEYQQVSYIAKGMKNMAKAIRLPVILLSQVSRKGGDGEVEVSLDMGRGSGAIEEAADVVLGLWQQEQQACNPSEPEYDLVCRVLKNRKGPKGRRWILELDPSTLRFGENATEYTPKKSKNRKSKAC